MKLQRQNSNNPKNNIRNTTKVFLILALFLISFAHFIAHKCIASNTEAVSPRLYLTVENEPLRRVLEKVSAFTGYTITINKEVADVPITARLKDVSLEEGLRRLLRGFNHTLVTQEEKKKIVITIYDRGQDSGKTPLTVPSEVIRPAYSRERDVPYEPIKEERMRKKGVDLGENEVIPPADSKEPEAVVIKMETLIKEMDALREKNKNGGSGNLIQIPPEEMLKKMSPQPESGRK